MIFAIAGSGFDSFLFSFVLFYHYHSKVRMKKKAEVQYKICGTSSVVLTRIDFLVDGICICTYF